MFVNTDIVHILCIHINFWLLWLANREAGQLYKMKCCKKKYAKINEHMQKLRQDK